MRTGTWKSRLATRLRGRRDRCRHLGQVVEGIVAGSEGCAACLAAGMRWVHLRMCRTCGQVGCCMSSTGRHALAHYDETGHPIISSLEPGEDWLYCFVDWKELEP